MIQKAIERIRKMELYFDLLQKVMEADPRALFEDNLINAMFKSLTNYYHSRQWMDDYELDEKGLLPDGLKRGILSEDGIYNFISDVNDLGKRQFEI